MATITRRTIEANQAAQQASDAARVLQARGQESKAEKSQTETTPVESQEPETRKDPRGDPERVKARNPIRAQAMESIREARGEKPPETIVEEPQSVTEDKSKEVTAETPETPVESSATQQNTPGSDQSQTPADAAPAVVAEPLVKVKIDGEEIEVKQSEVEEYGGVKAYQVSKAAENRLKKANEALAQARQMQELVAQFAQKQIAPPQPQMSDAEFIASKMDVIRYGTPEEGAQALTEIQQRQNPKIDQNLIINQAVTKMKYDSALQQFFSEFQDLTKPEIMEFVEVKARNKMAQLPQDKSTVDWSDFWRRIGNETRNVVGRPSQPASVPQTTGNPSMVSSDKEARKSSIVNLPTAASRAVLPEESKPETREESLARMRKARGIQVA